MSGAGDSNNVLAEIENKIKEIEENKIRNNANIIREKEKNTSKIDKIDEIHKVQMIQLIDEKTKKMEQLEIQHSKMIYKLLEKNKDEKEKELLKHADKMQELHSASRKILEEEKNLKTKLDHVLGAQSSPPPDSRMMEFVSKSIKEKEAELMCPVCYEVAQSPIFMCQEMHLICAECRPKVHWCPECRVAYKDPQRRHRYAEKMAEELRQLKETKADMKKAMEVEQEAEVEPAPSVSAIPPPLWIANHQDPKIQLALQAMMNMGYTDEGSWLTNLLIAKDANIGKVLDILTPVEK